MEKLCSQCNKYTFGDETVCPECGSPLTDAGLEPGMIVGGFEIIGELGRGSNGIVYRARQVKLDREVALKILPVGKDSNKEYVESFFKEARAAAKLSHPSIVMAYDAGVSDDGIYFFAMELINGESLDHRISEQGPLELKDALKMSHDIAEGLEYAWRTQNLTHGDIKPANIIIDPFGNAKIADLGLAKTASEGFNGELMATPMFAAPEVCSFDFDRIGFKSDMYSYACTVYFILTGEAPFDENDTEKVMMCHINDLHVPLTERLPLFPQDISDFVDRMLAKDPDDRPVDWQEVVNFMTAAMHRVASFHLAEQRPARNQPKGGGKILLGVIITLVIAALAVAAFFYLKHSRKPHTEPPKTTEIRSNPAREHLKGLEHLPPEKRLSELQQLLDDGIDDDQLRVEVKTLVINLENELKKKQPEPEPEQPALRDEKALLLRELYLQASANVAFDKLPYSNLQEIYRQLETISVELKKKARDGVTDAQLTSEVTADLIELKEKIAAGRREAALSRLEIARNDLRNLPLQLDVASIRLPGSYEPREYYLMILLEFKKSLPLQPNTVKTLENQLNSVQARKLSETGNARVEFLRRLLPKYEALATVLEANKQLYLGKPLPWTVNDLEYNITEIDRTQISASRQVGEGAVMRARIAWNSLNAKQQEILLNQWIFKQPTGSFTKAEWSNLAGWMLTNNHLTALRKLIDQPYLLPQEELEFWPQLMDDLTFAPREYDYYHTLDLVKADLAGKKYRPAFQQLIQLRERCKMMPPGLLWPPELDQLLKALLRHNVIEPGVDLYDLAAQEFEQRNYARAFALTTTVLERYSHLPDFPKNLANNTGALQRKIIADYIAAPQAAPFARQEELFPPGAITKWLQLNQQEYRSSEAMRSSLDSAAELNNGIWRNPQGDKSADRKYSEQLAGLKAPWLEAALFDYGLLNWRFDYTTTSAEVMKRLLQRAEHPGPPAVLAMRYAVTTRNYPLALEAAAGLIKNNSFHAYQLSVARLLLRMQSPEYKEADFANTVLRIKAHFSHHQLADDFKLLDWAAAIFTNTPANFPDNLANCREKELLARLACDVLARDLYLDRTNSRGINMRDLLTVDNSYNHDLWYRCALLQLLQNGPRASAWQKRLLELNATTTIAAIPSYPKLVMLDALYRIIAENSSLQLAAGDYTNRISQLPLASFQDRKFGELLNSSEPAGNYSQMLLWNGIAAATAELVNFGTPPGRNFAQLGAPAGRNVLLWQEKLLLRDLATMLTAARKPAE